MTTYIAVHRIERRIDGEPDITEPGESIKLTKDELADLPAGAVRLPTETAPVADTDQADDADKVLSVADLTEAAKTATAEELAEMLVAEKGGKNRSTAIKAIEQAIKALEEAGEDDETGQDGDSETSQDEEVL